MSKNCDEKRTSWRNRSIEAHIRFIDIISFHNYGAVPEQRVYKAIELWRKAVAMGDNSVRLKLLLASAYARIGDKQSAIMRLRNLIMESPDIYKAHVEIARLLSAQGQSAEAYSFAKRARQLSPNNLGANLLEVQAHMRVLEATEDSEDSS